MADYIVLSMRDGDFRTIRSFVESIESVDEFIYEDEQNQLNLLHLAAGLDSVYRENIIDLLIEHGVDIDCDGMSESVSNTTALHLASMWGYHDTVKLLLHNGADPSLRASNGYSAIDYATVFDNYPCISTLLRYGARHADTTATTTAWSSIMDSSSDDESAPDSLPSSDDDDCLYQTAIEWGANERSKSRASSRGGVVTATPRNRQSDLVNVLSDIPEDRGEEYDPLDEVRDEDMDHNIDNKMLRLELTRLGRHVGPITNTTKRLYVKWLAFLRKQDRELTYSPRTTTKSRLNGHSVELTSIQTGKFAIKQALDLEREFLRISGSKLYHGSKQFFNYILIDPRITQNLPDQAIEASDSDTSRMTSPDVETRKPKHVMGRVNRKFNAKLFAKFIEGIFYIGKGQKRRDFDHLYDALADRGSIAHKKIDTIRSIWSDGYGVVSLHLFHNITDKEALTREALMIETVGLDNLTNLLRGTVQFRLGWNEHQRKLLGALLLFRAYTQHLNEGERQLRRNDLRVEQRK